MNLLSIRGGSARGILPLIVLAHIEEKTGKPIPELFDYFGGCSVGALLSSALLISDDGYTAKYNAKQVFELFLKHIKNSFSWSYTSYILSGFGLFGPKYTSNGLQSIISECCGDIVMRNLIRPVIFPAYDRIKNRPFYFDKVHHANIKVADSILAATAIPTYFESHRIIIDDKEHDFLDSAIVTNDCSQLVLLKATHTLDVVDKSKIFLLNLGTGQFPNTLTYNNGLLSWLPNIVSTIITGSEGNEVYELSLSLPKDNYYILDIPLDKCYSPDDICETTINYYLKTGTEWVNENQPTIHWICDQLLKKYN